MTVKNIKSKLTVIEFDCANVDGFALYWNFYKKSNDDERKIVLESYEMTQKENES